MGSRRSMVLPVYLMDYRIIMGGSDFRRVELVRVRMAKAGLSFLRLLITAGDVKEGKPSPETYLAGTHLVRSEAARCIVIKDAPAGITAGKRTEMRVIGIE